MDRMRGNVRTKLRILSPIETLDEMIGLRLEVFKSIQCLQYNLLYFRQDKEENDGRGEEMMWSVSMGFAFCGAE
jgi:hypothetical protein